MKRREFGLVAGSSLILVATRAVGAITTSGEASLDLSKVFPYIVPDSWVRAVGAGSLISRKLAFDLNAVLVQDLNGKVQNLSVDQSKRSGKSNAALFEIAQTNVLNAWGMKVFSAGFGVGADGLKYGGAEGSWLAPSVVLSSFFLQQAAKHLGTQNVLITIPNQERLVVFPNSTAAAGSSNLARLVKDGYSHHPKPVSKQIYKLGQHGRLESIAFEWLV